MVELDEIINNRIVFPLFQDSKRKERLVNCNVYSK